MDQSTFIQRRRYKVASYGQQGSAASNRYLDRNGSYHTETVAGRALDDTGGYCCEPPTVPEPPFDISGVPANGPSVQLHFTPGYDGRSPITNYLVSFDGITYEPVSPPATGPPILVTDLSYGTTYTFYLKAVNEVGESEPSDGVTVIIPDLPAAPTGLSGTPDSNSVSVAFTAGDDGGSPIINYWYSLNGGPLIALSPVVDASPVTIPGLTPSANYTIILAAENVVGVGANSNPITVTTLNPPVDPPTLNLAIADASSAYVYFTEGTGVITNYEWSTNGGITFTAFGPAITTSPVRIPGLTNGVQATIYLRSVISGGGTSAASNSIQVTPTGSATSLGPALYYDASGYSGSGPVQNSGTGSSSITGTLGAGVTYIPSVVSGVFDFTGIDSISFPQYNFGTGFTVCTWIYPRDATPGNNTINGIIANTTSNQAPCGFKLGWNTWTTDDKSIYFEAGNGGSGGANFTSVDIVTYDAWQHITYVFDQTNAQIIFFINGIAVSMQTGISTVAGICTNQTFNIGTFTDGSYGMNAQLASLKVFGATLNATDIYNDYATTKSRFGL